MHNIFFQTQSVHVSIYYLQWRDMIGVARDKSDKNMKILQYICAIQQFLGVKGCNICKTIIQIILRFYLLTTLPTSNAWCHKSMGDCNPFVSARMYDKNVWKLLVVCLKHWSPWQM